MGTEGRRIEMFRCTTLHYTATHCKLQNAATRCNMLKHTVIYCNTLHGGRGGEEDGDVQGQRTATDCDILQHTATYCNSLQDTATHRNTLQHTVSLCTMGTEERRVGMFV